MEWYTKWWAMPNFDENGRGINKWGWASLDGLNRPTESEAFKNMYRYSHIAREERYARFRAHINCREN